MSDNRINQVKIPEANLYGNQVNSSAVSANEDIELFSPNETNVDSPDFKGFPSPPPSTVDYYEQNYYNYAQSRDNSEAKFINTITSVATSYVGKLKESDNSYHLVTQGRSEAWCADFVTYCVRQTEKQTGLDYGWLGSFSVSELMQQAKDKGVFLTTKNQSNKASLIANNVKPGDIMIEKENGKSHTGIVIGVNSDGSFTVVEGNCGDTVKKVTYPATSSTLTGFIQMT